MPSILDAFPYPWHERAAQQLHMTLAQLNPTAQAALSVAQRAGVDTLMVNAQQAPIFVWQDILAVAATAGLTRQLVTVVHDLLPPTSPRRPFLAALLAEQPAPMDAEPLSAGGAPNFIADNDAVTEPEALLYHDDLTIQIGRVPGLIATLERLVALAPAVCRLVVDVFGVSMHGTGFRIGPDLLLTNWHVLHRPDDGTRASAVTAEFGYEDDGQGGALAPVAVPCDVATIVAEQADDWGVIHVQSPLDDAWPVVKLSTAVAPQQGSTAYIIQHPGGQRKRVGFVRNQVSFFNERVVHYLTDTQEGSSGAPVFDTEGRLIALHHAGGRPQDLVGRPPLKKNEGIRISRVVAGLQSAGVDTP